MNLTRKELNLNIDGEDYIMAFDNRSIATYKEIIGKPFTKGYASLLQGDDEAVLDFIASTLRRKSEPDKPLGKEVLEGDNLFFLTTLTNHVIILISMSLPDKPKNSKKKVDYEEDIDLDFLYYAYTTILGKSEEEFWRATLAKVYKQLEIHNEINSPKNRSRRNENKSSGETVSLKVLD